MADLEDYIEHLETLSSRPHDLVPLDVLTLLQLPEDAHAVAMTLIQLSEATEEELVASSGKPQTIVHAALKTLIRNRYAGYRKQGDTVSYFVAATDY
jgi:transcription initiation factor IIE alpha subunit